MSVTIADILRLPCLREASVLGGAAGLQKTVATVSVMEYTMTDDFQEYLLNNIDFLGSELVITAFASIKDNVASQCLNLRRMAEVGEVGLVLFYVGILVPAVSKELTDLADELEFPLICMPERRTARYSEVISEVMEAIILDRINDIHFQNEILERISRLPVYQRSINTVLRMLSDRVRTSLLLTDSAGHLLNQVYWPRSLEVDEKVFLSQYDESGWYSSMSQDFMIHHLVIHAAAGSPLELYILKQGEALSDEDVRQIVDVLQLSINLWNRGHGDHVLPELVQAILQDEPFKMHRIAEVFQVDVASIHNMLVVAPVQNKDAPILLGKDAREILTLVKSELSHICKTIITDIYEQSVVVFMDDPMNGQLLIDYARSLGQAMEEKGVRALTSVYTDLIDTAQVRRAYLQAQKAALTACYIYPGKPVFTQREIAFAENCEKLLSQGEKAVNNQVSVLSPIKDERQKNKGDLIKTLTVYLLDADSDLERCARKMFLHRNTVKYRLQRIEEKIGCRVGYLPDAIALYTAVALQRILETRD